MYIYIYEYIYIHIYIFIILCRSKATMKKCRDCFVRYCNAECSLKDWPNHKAFCHCIVDHLAMTGTSLGDKTSRKARKHREKMRSLLGRSIGAGYQFMDEATYMQRCQSIELHTPDELREFVPKSEWGDGAPNGLV